MLSFEGGKVLPYCCFTEEEKKPVLTGFFLCIKKGSPFQGSLTVYQSQLQEFWGASRGWTEMFYDLQLKSIAIPIT